MNQENFIHVVSKMSGIDPKFYPKEANEEGQRIIKDFEEIIKKTKKNLPPNKSLNFSIDKESTQLYGDALSLTEIYPA